MSEKDERYCAYIKARRKLRKTVYVLTLIESYEDEVSIEGVRILDVFTDRKKARFHADMEARLLVRRDNDMFNKDTCYVDREAWDEFETLYVRHCGDGMEREIRIEVSKLD